MRRVITVCAALAISLAGVSCKSAEQPPAPSKKKPGITPLDGTGEVGGDSGDSGDSGGSGGDYVDVTITDEDALKNLSDGDRVEINFNVTGMTGKRLFVAAAQMPDDADLDDNQTSRPSMSFRAERGTHEIQILVRDMEACEEEEGEDGSCDIPSSEFGSGLSKQGSYDYLSSTWRFSVDREDDSTVDPGGGNNNGGGQDNAQMLQTIMGLLQGGGTGGLDMNTITNLLGGMSGGQLGQVLQGLQGGGDIQSLLPLIMQGFTLTGDPLPNATITDPNSVRLRMEN